MIRREQSITFAAAQARVVVPLIERFELLDRKISLGVQLPRPTPGQLYGQLLRIFPPPALQVGGVALYAFRFSVWLRLHSRSLS